MKDQADTLRKMMRDRWTSFSFPPMVAVAGMTARAGSTFFTANLGALLAATGLRVLLVDADTGPNRLGDLFGSPHPSRGLTVVAVENKEENTEEFLLSGIAGAIERMPAPPRLILIDTGVFRAGGALSSIFWANRNLCELVVVATPLAGLFGESYDARRLLVETAREIRPWVIVNQVNHAPEARRVFRRISGNVGNLTEPVFGYLGHCARDEKITQSVLKRKILVDWDKRAASLPYLSLLARRLAEMSLNAGTRERRSGRLQEEPVPKAPRKMTGFQRILSGEVEA